jgi:hypothetical protein
MNAAPRRTASSYVFRLLALMLIALLLTAGSAAQKPQTPKEMIPESQPAAPSFTPASTHALTAEDLGAFLTAWFHHICKSRTSLVRSSQS